MQSQVYPDGPLNVSDPEGHVAHPLNGLGMLRRLGGLLKGPSLGTLGAVFADNEAGGATVLKNLAGRMREAVVDFPNRGDYAVGINGIALLQEAYNLNVSLMAEGIIQVPNKEFSSSFRLTWQEMVDLGDAAYKQGWMDTSIKWYEEATRRRTSVDAVLADKLASMKKLHDKMLDKLGPVSHQHRCNPSPFDPKLAKKKKFKKSKKSKRRRKVYDTISLYSDVEDRKLLRDNFNLMCSNDAEDEDMWPLGRPPEEAAASIPLSCYLHHLSSPFARLGPFKLEERSRTPFVAMLHDFLSRQEMSHLRREASSRLFRSLTGSYDDKAVSTLMRTSKQAWLDEKDYQYKTTVADDGRKINSIKVTSKDKIGFKIAERIQVHCTTQHTSLFVVASVNESI